MPPQIHKKQRSLKSQSGSASDIVFSPDASPASSPPFTGTVQSASFPTIETAASTPASAADASPAAYAPSATSTVVPGEAAQTRNPEMQISDANLGQQPPQNTSEVSSQPGSRTSTVIRPHGSTHGPDHLPASPGFASSMSISINKTPMPDPVTTTLKSTTDFAQETSPNQPVPVSSQTRTPVATSHSSHKTSQPIIQSSSISKRPPNIPGHLSGHVPSRQPAWMRESGNSGNAPAPSSSSKQSGGPAVMQPQPPQRSGSFPSSHSHLQHGSSMVSRSPYPNIELQPKTRPITLTQLVNEVKGIYVGLAMVESKCIEIDRESSAIDPQVKLDDSQWQALLNLHRTLLHEHHDFMLASQHPSASPALRRVAQKYAIPARMWRHGIHSFLELLRHRLPESREHMITFIYMSYSIIALLYETVRTFEDTWVECLGDLSRYRMAIEDDNQRVRDTWTNVSRRWYSLASDRAPTTGRLHHHLAILARPYVVTQLYYYVKSLCTPIPFTSTRESIMTLLDPVLNNTTQHVPPIELNFIKSHAILFKNGMRTTPDFRPTVTHLLAGLDDHIALSARSWVETGVYMAIVNSCSLLAYGGDDNVLMRILREDMIRSASQNNDTDQPGAKDATVQRDSKEPTASADAPENDAAVDVAMAGVNDTVEMAKMPYDVDPELLKGLEPAQRLVADMDRVVFARVGDANCHGYIHARLVWMTCLTRVPEGMAYVEHAFPWEALVVTLNNLLLTTQKYDRIEQEVYMQPQVDRKAEEEERIRVIQQQQQLQQQAVASGMPVNNPPAITETVSATNPPLPPPIRSDADKPLPDDWYLRGLLWSEYNFPPGWFANMDSADEDEKLMESSSTRLTRKERVLWMACRLATFKRWITYDATAHVFSVTDEFRSPPAEMDADANDGDFSEFQDMSVNNDNDKTIRALPRPAEKPTGQDADQDLKKAIPLQVDTTSATAESNDKGKGKGKGEGKGKGKELASLPDCDDDDSDTANFEEDDNDPADDVNFSDMEGMAREKVARLGLRQTKEPP